MKRRDGEAGTPDPQGDAVQSADKDVTSQIMPKQTTDVDRLVGIRITALRKARGLSQTALGNAVGVTFQQVQKYEKGSNRISASRLQGIAQLLDVPVAFFFEDAPAGLPAASETATRPARDVVGLLATSEGVQLANAFIAIEDAQVRRRLVDLAEVLAKRGDI